MKKIGIIGSGEVGKTLAMGFIKHSYNVMIGTEHLEKLEGWKNQNKVQAGGFSDTAKFGDILVLAVKGIIAKKVLEKIGREVLGNKIVIDTTNPIAESPPENGVIKFFTSLDKSLMEEFQEEFQNVRFVKAFNSIGNAFMVNPEFEEKPTMFFCGNDSDAKSKVNEILQKFGFEPQDMGKATSARAIEPLCILWCIPGFLDNEWNHAFRLIKK